MEKLEKLSEERLQAARDAPAPATKPPPTGNTGPVPLRGVPAERLHQTFDAFDIERNPQMKEALRACQAISAGIRALLFLYGDPGLGKTHLATAAFLAWHAAHPGRGHFWKVPDFLQVLNGMMTEGIREGWGDAGVERTIQTYAKADCLIVFDDIGAERETEWRQEQLYRMLDARYERSLPTLLTSNAAIDRLDQRIRSRWRSGFVFCEGKDQR